ncbi:MAG TPA: hypothetical protein VFG29_04470 [Syntrophales bacterium]|nr:hypothetical protein [Syntrophales bacterium]
MSYLIQFASVGLCIQLVKQEDIVFNPLHRRLDDKGNLLGSEPSLLKEYDSRKCSNISSTEVEE